MRNKVKERILMTLAALIVALMVLKLTYAVMITLAAVIQTAVVMIILLAGGYYGAKRLLFK